MKSFEVEFLKSAKMDIYHAKKWYNLQKHNLGTEFIDEIDNVYERIKFNPNQFPIIKKDIRKAVVKRFPYCLYYVVEPEIIRIFAVFHNSRNPIIWKQRVK
jgi:plasmid stabilization system protein ParE